MIYKRNCPKCNTNVEYTNKGSWYNANARKSKCKSCQNEETRKLRKHQKQHGDTWGGIRNAEKEKTMERNFHRNCPNCSNQMNYSSNQTLQDSIKVNTICNSCSTKKYQKGILKGVTEEQRLQMRATKAGFSNWEEYLDKYPKKEMYKREVWKYTYRNDLTKFENYDKRGRNGVDGAYQIDHIVSINEGWKSNIPAKEIGNITNLQMITWEENRVKW